jgi:single-strand DNA-binding protein
MPRVQPRSRYEQERKLMAAQTTLVGNTTADIELRYTQNGRAVGNVTIAVSDRIKDQQTGEYRDGDTWFARCTLWAELAEHGANSIPKGTRVIATGRITQREFEDREGGKRSAVEVTLDAIGPDLRYATAVVTRSQGGRGAGAAQGASNTEPWATTAPGTGFDAQTASWGSDSETPF